MAYGNINSKYSSLWSYFNIIGYLIMTQFFSVIKLRKIPKLYVFIFYKKRTFIFVLMIFIGIIPLIILIYFSLGVFLRVISTSSPTTD